MSIFDNLPFGANNASAPAAQPTGTQTFTFSALPESLAELQSLPEAALTSPFQTAALTVCALCAYAAAPQIGLEMLNYLKGPEPMSQYQIQFLKDRMAGKEYKARSFFAGSSPENNYIPNEPLVITVYDNPYSYPEAGWATLHMDSTGADSPRQIKCRLKPSTNQWFLVENLALSDIRVPVAADPWA